MTRKLLLCIWFSLLPALAQAQVKAEKAPPPATVLPARPSPHWVWVDDMVFHHMADGKAYLIDGDSGRFLGMLSTGFSFTGVVLPSDYSQIYSPETYFSRGTRGKRTDVVTFYDPRELKPTGEVVIPAKRFSAMPTNNYAALTDDDRFLLVYNFTPAQSVSVVDVKSRRFVGETDTAGCALVMPTGKRSFMMLCGNGGLLKVEMNDKGEITGQHRSPPFFDAQSDPVTEKAVRWGNQWLFVSFNGDVYPVDASGPQPRPAERWSLLNDEERKDNWRPGGIQHLAVHPSDGQLYALLHQGGVDSHKDPGQDVWVYDLDTHRRLRKIKLDKPATSIQVTRDAKPLLFTLFIASPGLDVYDATSGNLLRSIPEIGFTPTIMQTP